MKYDLIWKHDLEQRAGEREVFFGGGGAVVEERYTHSKETISGLVTLVTFASGAGAIKFPQVSIKSQERDKMCGQTTEADLQSGWETISLPPSQVLRKRMLRFSNLVFTLLFMRSSADHIDIFSLSAGSYQVVDVHCHPTDMPLSDNDVRTVELGGLCAMATRAEDQELVHDLGRKYGNRAEGGAKDGSDYPLVISCFG